MEDPSPQTPAALRTRLEFPIWHKTFARSYAAWTSAPSDLKAPLLLTGPALAKAENWLIDCPQRLSDSEKRYIVRSIAQRSREPISEPDMRRLPTIRWGVRRQTDLPLWQLFAVIAVGLWFFSPDFIREAMDSSLNDPKAVALLKKGPPVAAPAAGLSTDPQMASSTGLPDDPDSSNVPDDGEHQTSIVRAAKPAPPPPISRSSRLTDLAEKQLEAGQQRTAFLLAIEAVDAAHEESRDTNRSAGPAIGILHQSMGTREALSPLATRRHSTTAAHFCQGAKGLLAVTDEGMLAHWPAAGADRSLSLGPWNEPLDGIALDPECRRIALANEDFNIEVRSLAGGRRSFELKGHEATILAAAFSPDGSSLATASQDATARLWDVRIGKPRAVLSGHDWQVTSIAYSPNSQLVVTASADMTARIWNATTGRHLHTLGGHQGIVTAAAFNPDGTLILTTSWDGFARLWDVPTGRLVRALKLDRGSITSGQFSTDGTRIATLAGDAAAHLWETATGNLIDEIASAGENLRSMGFSPDDRWLATLSWNGKVALRDAFTGAPLATLSADSDIIRSLSFTHRATHAVGITASGTRITWPLFGSAIEALAEAKSVAPPCLSADDRTLLGLEPAQPRWCSDRLTRGALIPR